MKNSPCAKLINRTTPNMRASPAATMAYIEPRVRPWITCSSRSSMVRLLKRAHLLRWRPRPHAQRTGSTPRAWPSGAASHLSPFEQPARLTASPVRRAERLLQDGGAGGDLLEQADLAALHLEQDHVDPRLVVIVELDGAERRLLHVDLLERVADGLAIGLAVLLERQLDRRHHRVLEGQRGEAAMDADGRLPALEPALLPLGIERGRPERGLHDALADGRVVLGEIEELDGGHAAAREQTLLEAQLAELPEEDAGIAGQHDEQDGVGVGALDLGQEGPVVGLAAVEEFRGDELDPELLEGGVVGGGGAPPEVVVLGDDRDRLDLLADVL